MIDGPTLSSAILGQHPQGLQFDDCYVLLNRLGSGSFGEVYSTQLKDKSVDSTQYACKVIDRSKLKKGGDETVFRELNILKDIRDLDHVTQLKDCFVTPKLIHMVQTLCRGGDVFDQLAKQAKYTEKDARDLASTLFKVMELLHLRRLAHRDLKPENLLLVNRMCASQIVVADFGMARYVPPDGFLSIRCGTPAFVGKFSGFCPKQQPLQVCCSRVLTPLVQPRKW
jgi:calcium-dependent protein kinase